MQQHRMGTAGEESGSADQDVRRRIIEASIRYMSVYGSHKLNMTDVARVAKVARATVYNYYQSKEGLMEAVEHFLDGQFIEALTREAAKHKRLDDRVAAIAILIRRSWTDEKHTPWFGFLSPLEEATVVISQSAEHQRVLIEFLEKYIVEAKKAGEIRANLDPPRTADWIARILFSFAFEPADKSLNKPGEIRRFIKDYLLAGLCKTKR
jgi:AcrR family transcriptional regulator